jgi:hypothetical protein
MDNDEDLRNDLIVKGLKQSEIFSDESYQKRINDVYKKYL